MERSLEVGWDDASGEHTVTGAPAHLVAERVLALDGLNRTVVTAQGEGLQVGVGGGNDGLVIAYYTTDSRTFFNLAGDPDAEGEVLLVAGGQPADYPRREVVPRQVAADAVVEVLTHGAARTFTWHRQQ